MAESKDSRIYEYEYLELHASPEPPLPRGTLIGGFGANAGGKSCEQV